MLAAIDGAQKQILFETYIWKGDEIGEQFKKALTAAADRGVEVYCIYDGFANLVVSPASSGSRPSMKVLRYPVYTAGWRFFDLRRYGRDHRKILVVDDEVGFVGGYNIGSAVRHRVARHARADHRPGRVGPQARLRRLLEPQPPARGSRRSERPLLLETASQWEPQIRVHRNVPAAVDVPDPAMYLEAINRASRNIWMTHAYFIPDQDFVDALKDAARRGVDVRLLLPLKSNHIVADWISRGYFGQLLDAGVRIFRFQDAMVHAKTATIDGSWSTVGTANIDRLSLQGNYEINVEVIDAPTGRGDGGDLRHRPDQLPRADHRRVGGARPAPQVHRDRARTAAPAALSGSPSPAGGSGRSSAGRGADGAPTGDRPSPAARPRCGRYGSRSSAISSSVTSWPDERPADSSWRGGSRRS